MNTQPNAVLESAQRQSVPRAEISPMRLFYWSVLRELWEYRSIYLAPLAVGGVYLVGFLISMIQMASHMRAGLALNVEQQREALERPYNIAAALIMGAMLVVQVFYCLDALYGERRDRSILFWKSLPVSDVTAVLAKASIPLVILPLLAFGITVVTQLVVRLLTGAVLLGSGLNIATRWTQLSFYKTSLMLLYHLVTVHAIWYAPFYGWLLLVSAWARRTPFLWAILPPLAISALEKIAFNTSHFATMLQYRFSGPEVFNFVSPGSMAMDPLQHMDLGGFLSTPGLWTGLVAAAAFLAAAVWLRRYRGPI